LGGGGPGWPGLDGRQQRATVAPDRCPRGAAVVKERGRSTSGPRGCQSLPLFGPRGSGKGSTAVAGARAAAMAGGGARRQWAVAAGNAGFRGDAEPLL